MIALLFPVVLAFSSKVQLNLIQAENFRNSVQSLRIARSGVQGAIGILKMDDAQYDSSNDSWNASFPSLALGEGAVQGALSVTVTDEDGKIPINLLLKEYGENSNQSDEAATSKTQASSKTDETVNDPVDRELEARLRALITNLGGDPDIINALIDWLDTDDDVTTSGGAEDGYYRDRGVHCKNGPLDSLDELLLIKGFDRDMVVERKLRDYLTVAPRSDTKINVNTAPLEVLQAVLGTETTGLAQPLNEGDIDDLNRYRQEHELKTVNDIGSAIKISQDQLGRIKPFVKVNSSYFTVISRYTIGRVVSTVEAMLERNEETVTIISWREF
jgi:general secretion pathway protein K